MTWTEMAAQRPVRLLAMGVAVYVGLCLLLFFAQGRLIYLPSKMRVELPPGFAEWRSPQGEFWGYRRMGGAERVLFFFHGNGGNASGWAHAVADFPGDVFVLEYPGYGSRAGRPTERGLKAAALEGFEAEFFRYGQVVVCGQSLGAAITEAIFGRYPDKVSALVLVAPFTSLGEMASAQFAWVPTRWILRDRMELMERWLEFPGRSVVVQAEQDEIIPRKQRLRFAAARSEKREIVEMEGASHNTIDLDTEFWERVMGSLD